MFGFSREGATGPCAKSLAFSMKQAPDPFGIPRTDLMWPRPHEIQARIQSARVAHPKCRHTFPLRPNSCEFLESAWPCQIPA